jgi:hypothetical protein
MLDATALRYADSINKNWNIIGKGAKRLSLSLVFALSAPVIGIITYFVV